ncbi:helix-turn-helix domain-containing protein [Kitasatospora sp. NPDC085879]|uniref:helix-turn-helix transcriptional regulator n=1 Tax=Kitasatospora sp. NPDC085879 TaxID=3154769 RepID=UPI000BB10F22|nr:helix-turn-helix domain-containing protein [Streptomyces sp. TLI_235]PBC69888.1 MarR family protein [Streptomyces sp. TLI_235]
MATEHAPRTSWTFLTHHARVLLAISRDSEVRMRDLAAMCGMTERAVQAIVTDLESAGYLIRTRRGRRNHYRIVRNTFFRHPAEAGWDIASLLNLSADALPHIGGDDNPETQPGDHHEHGDHPRDPARPQPRHEGGEDHGR